MNHAFISLFIAVAVALIGIGIIAPILPLYASTFAASGTSIGLVFSAFAISRALLGPVLGRLSDRVGRKRMILLGLGGYTVVSILYVLAMSLWQLGVFRFLQGAASVMVTPIAQAYIGDITPPGKEGRYMNLFYSSMFLGMAIGPILGGGLSELWSYQAAFYVMGILSFIALLLIARTVPADHGRPARAHTSANIDVIPLRKVLGDNAVRVICMYSATRGFWRQGFNTFYPLFAVAASELGEASIGAVLSSYMLGGAILQIPFGFLADRFRRFPQILIGSALAPMLLLTVPFLNSITSVLIVTFAIGALSAFSRASILAIRTEVGRTYGMGTLAGLQSGAFSVGRVLGPLACGVIADLVGVRAVFPFGAGVGLVGTVFVASWLKQWYKGLDSYPVSR